MESITIHILELAIKCTARSPGPARSRFKQLSHPEARGHDSMESQQMLKWQENGEVAAQSLWGRKDSENTHGTSWANPPDGKLLTGHVCLISQLVNSLD